MNDDVKAEIIAATIDRFLMSTWTTSRTDDLAWAILRALNKAQARPVQTDAD
ncbi:hypothetical protein [Streptomyces sp. NPDC127084]|uniref:hypothetical protein n=1 Tax=Streptomyces sp. NPDC127084 TaxID=3347133 RepID=UPI00365A8229